MNGISALGVPWGTKCSNMWFILLVHPNSINLSHKGRASVMVSTKCLVLVKMYGNSPKKLFIRIIVKREMKMNEFPLFFFPLPRIVFISLCSLFNSRFVAMLFRDGMSHILVEMMRIPMIVLVQFIGILMFSVVGSKIENRLVIIFN
jgi:hypothetical protein